MTTSCLTILESLSKWSSKNPSKKAWYFLDDKGEIIDSISYLDLDAVTSVLATHLKNNFGLNTGDRAMLVFVPGLAFSISLLACFKAGIIAVPVFPPDPRRVNKDLHHFISIQSSSGAQVALTDSQYSFAKKMGDIKRFFTSDIKWPDLRWHCVDDIIESAKRRSNGAIGGSRPIDFSPNKATIAFLQYTSGSTSEPKGVMISHGNLAHNLSLITKELRADEDTVNISWLPQYHDMGLIGSYLGIISCGGVGYYMSPISFLKDPVVWIRSISNFHGTHTQAPNFAYALAVRKFDELIRGDSSKRAQLESTLNLSSVRHMINAAEPVDIYAVNTFYQKFGKFGLPHGCIYPTYGLAEHTVFVCSGGDHVLTISKMSLESGEIDIVQDDNLDEYCHRSWQTLSKDDKSLQMIVGCGYPSRGVDVEVLIVDGETHKEVEELMVGEIWVTSPSKAFGYWNLSELTKEDFHAVLSQGGAGKEYLRTGDLGFFHNEELFICGRSKDLIIVRGTNHYPQDIERTAEKATASLRPGCSAAFALKGDAESTESVIYVAEIKEGVLASSFAEIVETVRQAVSSEHGVALSVVCLLQTRSVPKTTSGKIARSWCRRGYLDKSLHILYKWEADNGSNQAGGDKSRNQEALPPHTNFDDGNSSPGGPNLNNNGNSSKVTVSSIRLNSENLDGSNNNNNNNRENFEVSGNLDETSLRQISVAQIEARIELSLVQVCSQGPSPIYSPVDRDAPFVSLGLDSMTMVQFKGVLENRYFTHFPDDFFFSNICTVHQISIAIKEGQLTPNQLASMEQIGGPQCANGDAVDPDAHVVVKQKQPCCPWCFCCY